MHTFRPQPHCPPTCARLQVQKHHPAPGGGGKKPRLEGAGDIKRFFDARPAHQGEQASPGITWPAAAAVV